MCPPGLAGSRRPCPAVAGLRVKVSLCAVGDTLFDAVRGSGREPEKVLQHCPELVRCLVLLSPPDELRCRLHPGTGLFLRQRACPRSTVIERDRGNRGGTQTGGFVGRLRSRQSGGREGDVVGLILAPAEASNQCDSHQGQEMVRPQSGLFEGCRGAHRPTKPLQGAVRPCSPGGPAAARDGMPSPQVSSGTEPVPMKSCMAPNLGQLFTARSPGVGR